MDSNHMTYSNKLTVSGPSNAEGRKEVCMLLVLPVLVSLPN